MRADAVADAALGARLLDGLDASQIPYAILHGEADLSRGILRSDVDLVVGVPIADVVKILRKAAENAGAGLIMVSPYDEGGLATFWLRRDWSGGVQIDLLRDLRGRNKLAFKTDVALRHVMRGQRWMTLTPAVELAYLLSKRWLKGDSEAFRQLRAQADAGGDPLSEVLTARRARAVIGSPATSMARRGPMRGLPLLRSRLSFRGARRLRYPVGLLLGLTGDTDATASLAGAICDRLGPVVPKVKRTYGSSWAAGVRRSVALRRPQVLVAIGAIGQRPHIELHLAGDDDPGWALDQLWGEIVVLTQNRAEKFLRIHGLHS